MFSQALNERGGTVSRGGGGFRGRLAVVVVGGDSRLS